MSALGIGISFVEVKDDFISRDSYFFKDVSARECQLSLRLLFLIFLLLGFNFSLFLVDPDQARITV